MKLTPSHTHKGGSGVELGKMGIDKQLFQLCAACMDITLQIGFFPLGLMVFQNIKEYCYLNQSITHHPD